MAAELYIGMVFGGFVAALWSFLMARYVAGPRAKTLMVGTLRGDTAQDKRIVAEIRENLVRPEIQGALQAMKLPVFDLAPLTAKLDALQESIPEFDEEALYARLDALGAGLPDMVGTHVSMAIKGVQATESKAMQAQLSAMGLEGVIDETKDAIIAQIPASKRMMHSFMSKKLVSKAYAEDHPESAMLLELGRIGMATLLEQQEAGAAGVFGGNGVEVLRPTGFGVR